MTSVEDDFPLIRDGCDAEIAQERLLSAGWSRIARGDWAFVHASPCGRFVARVTPIDPAYALHARDCLADPGAPYFPRIDRLELLPPFGTLVFMERLEEADPERASELCCLLGAFGHLEEEPDETIRAEFEARRRRDPELQATRERLERTSAEARARIGFFGGLDLRPENVMQDAAGRLKLIDPYFVRGKDIIDALLTEPATVTRHYSARELAAFLEIAAFDAERDAPGPVLERLREVVAGLSRRTPRTRRNVGRLSPSP